MEERLPKRSFRCEDELWQAALDAAHYRGDSLARVIRRGLANYVRATDRKRAEDGLPPGPSSG